MRVAFGILFIFLFSTALSPGEVRTFTDDQGRRIEAEMIGLQGENVVLRKNGRLAKWPLNKLSREDQDFIAKWKQEVRSSPKVRVKTWERDGIGAKGLLNEERLSPMTPEKNIPLLKQTEEKSSYRHYDVELHNDSPVDASNLVMAYVLYVITPSRQVIGENGSETVPLIKAGARGEVTTQGITFVRSKTTSATIGTNILGNLQIDSDTTRSKESFGGIWVRVFAANGELAGESRDLSPALEKLNPEWLGEKNAPSLPTAASFEQLEQLLAPLKKLIENVPVSGPLKEKLPPPPPFPPRP